MKKKSFYLLLLCLLIVVPGCARIFRAQKQEYQTVTGDSGRNTDIARQKNAHAIAHMNKCEFNCAEQLLNEALIADVSFGPAHNTLGKVYYHQKKYYLAAWEFEYANRQMPERTEPINNLGLVYEAVGQYDRAIGYYEQAVSGSPDTAEYLGNLIRARITRGDKPFEMQDQINQLILLDDRREWVNWAKIQLYSDDSEAKLLRNLEQSAIEDDNSSHFELDDFRPYDYIGDSEEVAPAEPVLNPPLEEIPSPPSVLQGSSSR